MGVRCCSARSPTPTANCGTCTSRVRGGRRSAAGATAWPLSDRCCANTSSAKPCTRWAFPAPGPWPWWERGAWCSVKPCCREPCSPGSPPVICAWAAFSTLRPRATLTWFAALPIMRSPGTTRPPRKPNNPYLALFQAVAAAQASLVARWMLVGFVHGVMNTDNMTISGETIDYGPCAFMDGFDPASVYSSVDETGRYAYRNQPVVAEWNLARLAESLLPLLHEDQEKAIELAVESLADFRRQYSAAWAAGMNAKLGSPPRARGRRDLAPRRGASGSHARGTRRLHLALPQPWQGGPRPG